MDPEKKPATEPTPPSPAPTPTSPVTSPVVSDTPSAPATTPAAAPAHDPTTSADMSPTASSTKARGPKSLIIAIIAAVIVVGGLVFLFLSPWSPFTAAAPQGPKLMVGNNKYVYACPVMDKALIAKQLDLKTDVNKEGATETNAYDPANTKDKQEDLSKATNSESLSSSCVVKLDRVQEGSGDSQRTSFINVSASLEQYTSEDKARKAFEASKQQATDAKSLPSFANSSYYEKPQALYRGLPVSLSPQILHKNMIITLSAPTGTEDTTGDKNAPKLDAIAKDMVARIDRGEGQKIQNFNGSNMLGGNHFTDSCASVNYAKVAQALGNNTQFNIQSVSGTQAYAPDNNKGKTPNQIVSGCTFTFRTQSEADASKDVKKDALGETGLGYSDYYPHFLTLQTTVTASKNDAQTFLKQARDQATANAKKKTSDEDKATVTSVPIGDGAIAVSLIRKYPAEAGQAATNSSGKLYYIANGSNIYILSTTYVQHDEPFKSQIHDLSTDQAKQIYKELTVASRRAN